MQRGKVQTPQPMLLVHGVRATRAMTHLEQLHMLGAVVGAACT